jgi:tetratricopeptide (TPR) repeat protein
LLLPVHGRILPDVKAILRLALRWICVLTVAVSAGFLLSHLAQRTAWFKEHLYRRLVHGDDPQKVQAASLLGYLGGESQLMTALKSDDETVRKAARRALEHVWFSAAGSEAYALMESAYAVAEEKRYDEALQLLDQIVSRFPSYAEAWNRRGAVLWQLGEYQKSLRDCQRAIALNPNHYGAWQGLGVSHLQLGDLPPACASLRTALKLDPHDATAQRCLKKCEELLRQSQSIRRPPDAAELL